MEWKESGRLDNQNIDDDSRNQSHKQTGQALPQCMDVHWQHMCCPSLTVSSALTSGEHVDTVLLPNLATLMYSCQLAGVCFLYFLY